MIFRSPVRTAAVRRRRHFLEALHVFPPQPIQILSLVAIKIALETHECDRPAEKNEHLRAQCFEGAGAEPFGIGFRKAADPNQPFRIFRHAAIEHRDGFRGQCMRRRAQQKGKRPVVVLVVNSMAEFVEHGAHPTFVFADVA